MDVELSQDGAWIGITISRYDPTGTLRTLNTYECDFSYNPGFAGRRLTRGINLLIASTRRSLEQEGITEP
jgi:hypothetical protein